MSDEELAEGAPWLWMYTAVEYHPSSPRELRAWPLIDRARMGLVNRARARANEEKAAKDKWSMPRGVYE